LDCTAQTSPSAETVESRGHLATLSGQATKSQAHHTYLLLCAGAMVVPWPWPSSSHPIHLILVGQTNQRAAAEGTNPPRWSLLGRTESPAAWKREKSPESAQVASGMLNPWPACLLVFWGSHSRVPAPLGSSLHAERPLNKRYGLRVQGARAMPRACDNGCSPGSSFAESRSNSLALYAIPRALVVGSTCKRAP
jgi:hypothetical protein